MRDGIRVALYHPGGPPGAAPLVWGHANGFCTGSYAALLDDLSRDHDVWAWDMRGQGRSELPDGVAPAQALSLERVAEEAAAVCALVHAETGEVPHAAGHSFGALALLHAAREAPPWRSGCFFEPPIPTREMIAEAANIAATEARIRATLRRRRRWTHPQSFAARLRAHAGYAGIADAVLQAHARAVLREADDGWELRCPPEVEAEVYRLTFSAAVQDALRPIQRPLLFVVSSAMPVRWPAAAQVEAARRSGGRLLRIANTTHLLPLDRPEACASVIRQMTRGGSAPEAS